MDLAATAAGRRVLFAALYFAEGAPIGFLWWALPATLREAGAPVEAITGLTAMLALRPGRRRWWILGCQALIAVTLAPLRWMDRSRPRRRERSERAAPYD